MALGGGGVFFAFGATAFGATAFGATAFGATAFGATAFGATALLRGANFLALTFFIE
jgi:hypothetical protein